VLATLIQRQFSQLDENGNIAANVRDKVNEADRKKKFYEQNICKYRDALLGLPDLF